MTRLLEELKKQTRRLTTQEKVIPARFLTASLDEPITNDMDQLWIVEAERRYQAYRKGEIESSSR